MSHIVCRAAAGDRASLPPPRQRGRRWRRWLGFSAAPALRPRWRPLTASPEVLSLGPCLPGGERRGVLSLENGGAVPMAFSFEGPVDCGGGGSDAAGAEVPGGRLTVRPPAGGVAPGAAAVCQVSFRAGPSPALFEAELRCAAWPAEEGGCLARGGAGGGLESGGGGLGCVGGGGGGGQGGWGAGARDESGRAEEGAGTVGRSGAAARARTAAAAAAAADPSGPEAEGSEETIARHPARCAPARPHCGRPTGHRT
jgi:hypothetical protein